MDLKSYIEKVKKELFYMGLTQEQFQEVKAPIAEDNRRSIVAWSLCAVFFFLMSLMMSVNLEAYRACRTVYIGVLIISILTFGGASFLVKRFPWTLSPIMYVFEMSILGAGLGIALCQPDVRTVTLIAAAVIVPASIIDCTISDILVHVITVIAYAVLAHDVIEPEIFRWGLTNLIIFSVVGIMIGHVINKSRFERYVYAESVKRLAEIQTKNAHYDQLSGLKNRRSYVEELKRIEDQWPENFCIIMTDLNGLKRTNDTLGHEAGDELIIGASECLCAAFKNTDMIFRIGGDEFCIIMLDKEEEAERCLKELDRITADWKGPRINGISISYGVATNQDQSDINSIVVRADEKMYEHKQNYYRTHGNDR